MENKFIITKEEQKELLSDLCSRLPYGVKISIPDLWTQEREVEILDEIFKGDDGLYRVNSKGKCIEYIKPYLFPMSSMTEEQRKEYEDAITYHGYIDGGWAMVKDFANEYVIPYWFVDFCNKNHLDYRGWINVGLAIDASGKNIY